MEDDEAPLPVCLQAFAAQHAEACEEELDRNGENEQPGEPDEGLARTSILMRPSSCLLRGRPRDRKRLRERQPGLAHRNFEQGRRR